MNSNEWKNRLGEEMYRPYPRMEEVYESTYATKEKEVGIVHPTLGTGLLFRNNGSVDFFSDHNLGIRMNPEENTLSLYASKIMLHTDSVINVDYENKEYFTKEMAEVKKYMNK